MKKKVIENDGNYVLATRKRNTFTYTYICILKFVI